jgi:hypothetical protein
MQQYLRCLELPIGLCLAGLTVVAVVRGLPSAWITFVLLVLEISLSFDNAVVNARVLERLTPRQQQFFLTWGLVIPGLWGAFSWSAAAGLPGGWRQPGHGLR